MVICGYPPPPPPPRSVKNTSSIGDFLKEFSTFIEAQMSSCRMFLFGSDFNIGNDSSSDASKFLDLLASMDLKQHVIS